MPHFAIARCIEHMTLFLLPERIIISGMGGVKENKMTDTTIWWRMACMETTTYLIRGRRRRKGRLDDDRVGGG